MARITLAQRRRIVTATADILIRHLTDRGIPTPTLRGAVMLHAVKSTFDLELRTMPAHFDAKDGAISHLEHNFTLDAGIELINELCGSINSDPLPLIDELRRIVGDAGSKPKTYKPAKRARIWTEEANRPAGWGTW